MVVVPEPDCVPPFQLKAEVTLIDCEPVIVPVSVRVATVTGTSSVTVWPTVAVSPAPGTPAPPHVEEALQLPFWELVKLAAPRGRAARRRHDASNRVRNDDERDMSLSPPSLRNPSDMPRSVGPGSRRRASPPV